MDGFGIPNEIRFVYKIELVQNISINKATSNYLIYNKFSEQATKMCCFLTKEGRDM